MTKPRFSIWGREHGSDHDVEIISVETNPQAVLDGLMQKTLTVQPSLTGPRKRTKIRKYSWLRIEENKRDA